MILDPNNYTVMFSSKLAEKVGVYKAIFLEEFRNVMVLFDGNNRPKPINHDGFLWYELQGDEFLRLFPYMTISEIREALNGLLEEKILICDTNGVEQLTDELFCHNKSGYRFNTDIVEGI